MLRDLLLFEWRYHTRQVTWWAGVLLFLVFGFVLPATSYGPPNLAVNSPFLVMQSMAFLSLLSVFAAGVFASSAVLRDVEHGMDEIVRCAPVTRLRFVPVRFAGAFLASCAAASAAVVGMLAGTAMPWLEPDRVASVDLGTYAWAFFVLMVPNVLFATVILLVVAVMARSALAAYAGSVVLYLLYFIAAALTDSPLMAGSRPGAIPPAWMSLIDPFGLTAFFDLTRYWSPAARNARLVPLEGVLLWNRLLWTGGSLAIAALVSSRFSLERRGRAAPADPDADVAVPAAVPLPAVPRVAVAPSFLASYRSLVRLEVRSLASVPLLLLLLLWTGLAASEIQAAIGSGEYGARLVAAASLVVSSLQVPVGTIGLIVLIYFGAEIYWRERRHGIAPIVDATPVDSAAIVAAKWTAMAVLAAGMIAAAIAAGVALQVASGVFDVEPLVHLSLFWFSGVPLVLFAAAVILVQALSPNKYAGILLAVLAALGVQLAPRLGLEHPLWRFAVAPPVRYSDMNGFGHDPVPFHWMVLHWAALGAVFLSVAARAWRRMGDSVRERLAAIASAPRKREFAAIALALLSGGWVVWNTDVLGARTSDEARNEWKAAYERTWKGTAAWPQPSVARITAAVDLHPGERRHGASGTYVLVNDTRAPITTILVSTRREARTTRLSIAGARTSIDARFGMTRFDLARPLAPGERTMLEFELQYAERGFQPGQPDDRVVGNGSFLLNFQVLPAIGYRPGYELRDPVERRRHGLPPLEEDEVAEGPSDGAPLDRIDLDLTVSTAPDQTAVAPGRLVRSWQAGGRRHFRFRTDRPIFNRFAIASARYDVARRTHGAVDVVLYHHPAHRDAARAALDAAVATLDYCIANFGPYPARQLRLAEIPSYWPFGAFAMPETVFLVEDRTMLVDVRHPVPVDLLARRVAHEVAHQWWGHTLAPSDAPGATVLVESLTKYTDMMVLERMRGGEQVRTLRQMELDRYLAGRANETDAEPPLAEAGPRDYLYYGKGSLALYAIRERIGTARVNAALRNLLRDFRDRGGEATTGHLIRHLQAAAGPKNAALVETWFRDIVLDDFRLESARASRRPDGLYDVSVSVVVNRRRADAEGRETPLPFDGLIDLALYGADETPLVVEQRRLHSGRNELRLTSIRQRPVSAAVDPDLLHVDTSPSDNVRTID